MSYLRLSDAQTAYKHQLNQDDMRQLRDNQDDHEARIAALLAQNVHSIADDFLSGPDGGAAGSWIDTNLYDGSGGVNLMETDGSHVWQITTVNSAQTNFLSPLKTRCRLRFNKDMAAFLEFRVYEPGATVMDNIMFGLQNRAVSTPATEADVMGFFKGSTAGKWRFRVASGGVQTETNNIGNRAAWQKLRMELLRSGGGATQQVRAFIDGAEISGSPFTTNIPTSVVLKPFMGAVSPGSGTTDLRTDRWEIRWTAVPVNP
jgi:hypothetical protein